MKHAENAVIVGFGPGIGAATAEVFGREGHALTLIARDGAKVKAAAEDLSARGVRAVGIVADAGDEEDLTAAIRHSREMLGDPTVLIYNAAAWRPGPVLAVTAEGLNTDFQTCVAGALTAARLVAPTMRARGRGSILFTGGGLSLQPCAEFPTLSIGKAGIRMLALMLAEELGPSGVRVGTVTVAGAVAAGSTLSAERVAEAFLALHRDRSLENAEVVLRP